MRTIVDCEVNQYVGSSFNWTVCSVRLQSDENNRPSKNQIPDTRYQIDSVGQTFRFALIPWRQTIFQGLLSRFGNRSLNKGKEGKIRVKRGEEGEFQLDCGLRIANLISNVGQGFSLA
ncbi:MAG: hypothetical protein ACPL28_10085, partial [bacterium]